MRSLSSFPLVAGVIVSTSLELAIATSSFRKPQKSATSPRNKLCLTAFVLPCSSRKASRLRISNDASAYTSIENVKDTKKAEIPRATQEALHLLPNQTPLPVDRNTPFAQTLTSRGVVRVDGGLSLNSAASLRDYIDRTLEDSIEEVATFKVPRAFRFANVLESNFRWDLLLPFDDDDDGATTKEQFPILQAMDELLGEGSVIGSIFEEVLGPDAVLYEMACLVSDPGSQRQEIHPDIVYSKEDKIPIVACFVSLQDIDETMGPTVFLPDTVTEHHHRCINDPVLADDMLRETPSYLNTLASGDCSLYNPMVLHAGGGNESERRRRLFYVTFLNPSHEDPSHDFNPGSIRPDLKMRALSLKDIRDSLKAWREGAMLER